MNLWEYSLYNMRRQKKDRVDALIKKYGFPIEEKNLLREDFIEYDLLKPELEAMKTEKLAQTPTPHGSSLDDEDMAKNAAIVKAKKEAATHSQYGDATAKELDNYIKDYKLPKGKTRTGLIAPIHDLARNYFIMKEKGLDPSDHFFHCKANYEAASRGEYGATVARELGYLKEIIDQKLKGDSAEASNADLRANFRGRHGALMKKTLKETCPTHYKKYK